MKKADITRFLTDFSMEFKMESSKEKKKFDNLRSDLSNVLLSQNEINVPTSNRLKIPIESTDDKKILDEVKDIVAKAIKLKGEEQVEVQIQHSDRLYEDFKRFGTNISLSELPILPAAFTSKSETFKDMRGIEWNFNFSPFKTDLKKVFVNGQTYPLLLFKTKTFRFPIPFTDLPKFSKIEEIFGNEANIKLEEVLPKVEKTPISRVDIKKLKTTETLKNQTALAAKISMAELRPKVPNFIKEIPEKTKLYQLAENTVWVYARLFNANAPEGSYCPLRIKNGTAFFNRLPLSEIKNDIIVSSATTITITLDLENEKRTNPSSSIFGEDARKLNCNLPDNFKFSIRNSKAAISDVGEMSAKVYQTPYKLMYSKNVQAIFSTTFSTIGIPFKSQTNDFTVTQCLSEFTELQGSASIKNSFWVLPIMVIDLNKPPEAAGNGGILFQCESGLRSAINKTPDFFKLSNPEILVTADGIAYLDFNTSGTGLHHNIDLWKDDSALSTLELRYLKKTFYFYSTTISGEENLMFLADTNFDTDRPVKASGEAIRIKGKNSLIGMKAKGKKRSITIYDNDLLKDNASENSDTEKVKPIAIALQNALLTVSPPTGFILTGNYNDDFSSMQNTKFISQFAVFNYIPTLPDPYMANLSKIRLARRDKSGLYYLNNSFMNIVASVDWEENADINTSFDFVAKQTTPTSIQKQEKTVPNSNITSQNTAQLFQSTFILPEEGNAQNHENTAFKEEVYSSLNIRGKAQSIEKSILKSTLNEYENAAFTLLDVSGKANQTGVSFSQYTDYEVATISHKNEFPIQIQNQSITTPGRNAALFLLPQVAWEPLFNTATPDIPGDPPLGFNYYAKDGLPTIIKNRSNELVPLEPIPMVKYLEKVYKDKDDKLTYAIFNLPFGMIGVSILDNNSNQKIKPTLENLQPEFENEMKGGIQLELKAGSSLVQEGEANLFQGFTIQLKNVLDLTGTNNNSSTLGSSVHTIFNREFSIPPSNPKDKTRPGVPLERIGLSGYGASSFSNWTNKNAAFAATSQATFNIAVGRTIQEVVQVKSMIYPWGIAVVRTITIIRMGNGYVLRMDSGWQAESNGLFYFGLKGKDKDEKVFSIPNPIETHPGLINGLYNIRNIREVEKLSYSTNMQINIKDTVTNPTTYFPEPASGSLNQPVQLQGVTFDADIMIDHVTEGLNANKKVPANKILGFVQLAPRGIPLSKEAIKSLMEYQNGSIGGSINCTIKAAGTDQYMKISRFDMNLAKDESNTPILVGALRGSPILPKEGSWSVVQHSAKDGTVSPLEKDFPIPLIKIGEWDEGKLLNLGDKSNLERIAHPVDLKKLPDLETINFGFLQNLGTQKVLFLTPSFKNKINSLLSKTPPLMADAYRMLNSKGIFPNIGDGISALGEEVFPLLKVPGQVQDAFSKVTGVLDSGKEVYELMNIISKTNGGKLLDQGFELLKKGANGQINKLLNFSLPNFDYSLINTQHFKVKIRYAADPAQQGKLDYTVASFADDVQDQWRSRMNNLSTIVSLGPFDDLITITGNFNSEKGKDANYGGGITKGNDVLPTPKITFSKAVEPVFQILSILEDLSKDNLEDTFKKGLKIAMSNSANIWEYKYEASKEIGPIRFPGEPNTYNSPQTPLRLEAALSLGFYFNAALKVTTDPKELLPTAGAFFKFHGGLQVMCASIGGASIYAIGNVDLLLSANTKPELAVDMKFGFGAQLAVGLPVIGNVSIEFMVGIAIYADTGGKVAVTAIMFFRGRAEVFGGIATVTITIEAKGSIEKAGKGQPCNCRASVSFALDINVALIIDISIHESWEETKQIS